MQPVLLVVQFLLAVALIGVILIQKTAQDGGGLTGGGSTMGGLFTARGSANLLTRTTAVLATLFILNSLALGFIASSQHRAATTTRELIDSSIPASAPTTQPTTQPAATPTITTTEKPAAKPPAAKKAHPKPAPAPEKAPEPAASAPVPDASAPAPEKAPAPGSPSAPEVPMAH